MALTPGTRLGPYEITRALGAGGMGEVYRARDTKLNRDVAIKVLPAAFAHGRRSARALHARSADARVAQPSEHRGDLRHRRGSGRPGLRALVMELVEGDDLSALIARGPMPHADAVPIARQIAEALEAAHEHGHHPSRSETRQRQGPRRRHREGARLRSRQSAVARRLRRVGGRDELADAHGSRLRHGYGGSGVIIGTAAYMAPEQAKGKPVDRRADIWAFGVVLYEMLSGRRAFEGEDVSETLAAVLTREPEFAAVPASTPPAPSWR